MAVCLSDTVLALWPIDTRFESCQSVCVALRKSTITSPQKGEGLGVIKLRRKETEERKRERAGYYFQPILR